MTDSEKKLIFLLAQKLTGVHPDGTYHHAIFLTNIERRMREKKVARLVDYLQLVETDPEEHGHLLSSLSIHTTSWFRENPHSVIFQQILLKSIAKDKVFRVWSTACSTGEEVYTFALLLEEFRRFNPKFEYKILGTDIDPVSLDKARKAVYSKKHLNGPITFYKNHVLLGSGNTEDFFTFSKEIRDRCSFKSHDIREPLLQEDKFDVVICRNVLIYFSPDQVGKVVKSLVDKMNENGHLILGHSEIINHAEFKLETLGHSSYRKITKVEKKVIVGPTNHGPNILVVDDSRTVRGYLKKEMEKAGVNVTFANSANDADQLLRAGETFDLITLDLNMPGLPGEDWLKQMRRTGNKTPIIIISNTHASQTGAVVRLLAEGAQAYLEKEDLTKSPDLLMKTITPLLETSKQNLLQGPTQVKLQRRPPIGFKPDIIMVGASTGGPSALSTVLKDLPPWCPPVILVQHISMKFAEPFANRMVDISRLRLGKMDDGEKLLQGHIYIALRDYHIGVKQDKEGIKLAISNDPARNGHRPSVDHLFYSAQNIGCSKMAILLTGMGKDGADGLKSMHSAGAFTVAQSEEDCVVFGMPREAILRNAVDFVGNCNEIYNELKTLIDSVRAAGF